MCYIHCVMILVMVRIKRVYSRIPSIGECTYTILPETVQLVVQTQCCFLNTIMGTIMYMHSPCQDPPQMDHLISYPGANTNYTGLIQLSLGAHLKNVLIRLNSYEKILSLIGMYGPRVTWSAHTHVKPYFSKTKQPRETSVEHSEE